jgi:hypothetical protein
MGNLEKPLTWVLGIVFVGYLFIANCECGEGSTCPLNNGFNINNTDINADVLKVDAPENVEEVTVEAIIIDSDTTIVEETNIDSSEAEIEAKVEIEEE